jgi:hypothetical protein
MRITLYVGFMFYLIFKLFIPFMLDAFIKAAYQYTMVGV